MELPEWDNWQFQLPDRQRPRFRRGGSIQCRRRRSRTRDRGQEGRALRNLSAEHGAVGSSGSPSELHASSELHHRCAVPNRWAKQHRPVLPGNCNPCHRRWRKPVNPGPLERHSLRCRVRGCAPGILVEHLHGWDVQY